MCFLSRRPRSPEEMKTITDRFAASVPLVANMVEGGKSPLFSAAELGAMGFRLVIFPGGIVRAFAQTATAYYANLVQSGSTAGFRDRMEDFDGLNEIIGTAELLAVGKTYGAGDT